MPAIAMSRWPFFTTCALAVLALLLALAALLVIPLTKFPTPWELDKLERILLPKAQLTTKEAQSVRRSLDHIRHNDARQLRFFWILKIIAVAGFCALALGFTGLAWYLRRQARMAVRPPPEG